MIKFFEFVAGLLTSPISDTFPSAIGEQWFVDSENTVQNSCNGITATGIVPDLNQISF
jgi:hypothetical protein